MSSAATAEPAETVAPPVTAVATEGGRPMAGPLGTTIVVGLGNPLLGDDGVGWRVADAVERRLGERGWPADLEVDRLCVGGLALMERLVGHARAILVDAVVDGGGRPGDVWHRRLDAVETRAAGHLDSAHDAPLAIALAAGRTLGAVLPDVVDVVGVVAERADTFDERLSEPVREAVPVAAGIVLDLLDQRG